MTKKAEAGTDHLFSAEPTGLRVEAPGKKKGHFGGFRDGAHAYLHVSEIWNGHDSHFRDVTPLESTEGNCKHIKHCIWKAYSLLEEKNTTFYVGLNSFWRERYIMEPHSAHLLSS